MRAHYCLKPDKVRGKCAQTLYCAENSLGPNVTLRTWANIIILSLKRSAKNTDPDQELYFQYLAGVFVSIYLTNLLSSATQTRNFDLTLKPAHINASVSPTSKSKIKPKPTFSLQGMYIVRCSQ